MTDKPYVHFEYLAETCDVAEFDHEGTRTEITTEVSCPSCVEELTRWVAEDTQYGGRCLNCEEWITAQGGAEWRKAVRSPCPHCGEAIW